ncbi:MAG: hypothetical protein U0528_09800 [Anaerolineae bacterium]
MLARFRIPLFDVPIFSQLRNIALVVLVGLIIGAASSVHFILGFALIIGVVAAYVSLVYPMILGYVLIFCIITTSGMLRGDIIPMLKINEAMLAVTAGVVFLVVMIRRPAYRIYDPWLVIATLILMLGTAVVPLVAYYARGWKFEVSEIVSLLAPVQFVILFWVFAYLPESDRDRRNLVQFMIVCASILSFVGLLQAAKIGAVQNFLVRWYPGDQTNDAAALGRVTTLFGAWNATGTFLMIIILLLVSLQPLNHPRWARINMYIALALGGATLLASGSFAGMGGLAAGIVIVKYFDRRGMKFLLQLFVALMIASIILSPIIIQRLNYQFAPSSSSDGLVPQTFSYRLKVWSEVYIPILMKSNPWFGVVPNMNNVSWAWAESQYVYLLMRSGVVSLIAHLVWVWMMCVWLWRKMKTTIGQTQILALVSFAVMILLSVMSFTNEVFTLGGVIDYLWIFIGLIANAGVNPVHDSN